MKRLGPAIVCSAITGSLAISPVAGGAAAQAASPAATSWPNPDNTGVPAGWTPQTTIDGEWRITAPGVYEDVLVNGVVLVQADDVTLRRVKVQNGIISNDFNGKCTQNLRLEQVTVTSAPDQTTTDQDPYAIGVANYTAYKVKIDGYPEGFRVGSANDAQEGCGSVVIEHSFVRATPPDRCVEWHGDGIQGYFGGPLIVRNVTLDLANISTCGGTAAFFYPQGQGNTSVDIDGLLVKDGSWPFRLGMPGRVRGLRIVEGIWGYGPIDVRCSVVSDWEAQRVLITPDYQVVAAVADQPCDTEGGT
jgi:hypothetical protein